MSDPNKTAKIITLDEEKRCAANCNADVIPEDALAAVDSEGWLYHLDCWQRIRKEEAGVA